MNLYGFGAKGVLKTMDEVLLVDKPKGISTYDIIRYLKKELPKGIKIGHAGTLDPFATGLVIVLTGKKTKEQNTFMKLKKEYIVEARFGISTDTQDITGAVIREVKDMKVLKEDVLKAIPSFLGKITQIPPRFSAKKVNGKRAYDLARENIEFELKACSVEVYSFEMISFEYPIAQFKICCSHGTYIRTLINDLGERIGVGATCENLRRTKIGEYTVDSNNVIRMK